MGKIINCDYIIKIWEERDRMHIALWDAYEENILAQWWDDDALSMIELGFFDPKDLDNSVIKYYETYLK